MTRRRITQAIFFSWALSVSYNALKNTVCLVLFRNDTSKCPFIWPTIISEFFPCVVLSNDPGKKGSTFFCCGAIRFPHIEMFSFLRRECINLQKGCLRKKMYLNSTFKGCIFVLKHFDQSQELQTMAKKCSQFYMIRTYDFCVT